MPLPIISTQNNLKIAQFANALYGTVVGSTTNSQVLADIASLSGTTPNSGFAATVNSYYTSSFGSQTAAAVAKIVVANLGIAAANVAVAEGAVTSAINAAPKGAEGIAVSNLLTTFAGLTADATFGASATAWNAKIADALAYTANGNTADYQVNGGTPTFSLTTGVDALVGTSGNDVFNAIILNNSNTLQSGDVIDGGSNGTNDVLNAEVGNSQAFAILPTLKSIETVNITASAQAVDSNNNNMYGNNNALSMTGTNSGNIGSAVSQLDAQKTAGVTNWVDTNSRADVIVEDVRIASGQLTKDITITMANTDPGNVDYGLYFDQLSLRNTSSGSASVNIFLMDVAAVQSGKTVGGVAQPLDANVFNAYSFYYNGNLVKLTFLNADGTANYPKTYTALQTAFQTALKTAAVTPAGSTTAITQDLSGAVTATLSSPVNFTTETAKATSSSPVSVNFNNQTGQIVVLTAKSTGTAGVTIAAGDTTLGQVATGWASTGVAPNTGAVTQTYNFGSSASSELVTSKIVLDNVGRGSTGGDLVVGGLSVGETSTSRGVERFEITVKENSKLQTINSTNNALREVSIINDSTSGTTAGHAYVTATAGKGNLTVNGNANLGVVNAANASAVPAASNTGTLANTGSDTILKGANSGNSGLNAYQADHHGAFGFTDVRLIDASAFTGNLAYTAQITRDSIAKYHNLIDTQATPTGDVAVNGGNGTFGNGNFSINNASATTNSSGAVNGANFVYTSGSGNDTLNVVIDGGVAASRSSIVSGQSDFTFTIDGGAGDDAITVSVAASTAGKGNIENWYNNQDLNNNILVRGGDGNDTIRTPGAGDKMIDSGTGNDVIYTENTGVQALAITANSPSTASNGTAKFVFNTTNQTAATLTAADLAARNINDLRSDNNTLGDNGAGFNLFNGKLTVTYLGITTATAVSVESTGYKTSDLQYNQAIKAAINNDAVLKTLLLAQDGPGNTLVVTALSDGVRGAIDLTVTVAAPAAGSMSATDIAGAGTAYGIASPTDALVLAAMSAATTGGTTVTGSGFQTLGHYNTVLATDGLVNITGANSTATSDNLVTGGAGNDVIVLGTTVGATTALSSNETVVYNANFGNDTIVNFSATGMGVDHLDFTALNGVTLVAANTYTTDQSINIGLVATGVNDTAANVAALFNANNTAAQNHVYVAYTASGIGSVYTVADGAGASNAVATLQGTIDLAATTDTIWGTLTQANFVNSAAAGYNLIEGPWNALIAGAGPAPAPAPVPGATGGNITAAASVVAATTAGADVFTLGTKAAGAAGNWGIAASFNKAIAGFQAFNTGTAVVQDQLNVPVGANAPVVQATGVNTVVDGNVDVAWVVSPTITVTINLTGLSTATENALQAGVTAGVFGTY